VSSAEKKVELPTLFCGLQDQMIASLRTGQALSHSGDKGQNSEENWLKVLRDFLPKRYQAEKASVIDSKGSVSDQIDIVIFDQQYSPFMFTQNGVHYVPAESVYAIIEAKPAIDAGTIKYAGEKAASVRRLYRTSAKIAHAGGIHEPKTPFPIQAGIVATSSGWKSPLHQNLVDQFSKLEVPHRLDFGCVLNTAGFTVDYSTQGPNVSISKSKTALMSFFLDLLSHLQGLGTVPAIEFGEYMKSL
jgi:hypothetical protein